MTAPPTLACADLITFQDGKPHLQGGQCADCQESYFPAATRCTRCRSTNMRGLDLGARGVLWSWTIQQFLPKAPYAGNETADTFQPYGVGYVQMACGLKVEARLTEADPAALSIGMPMTLVLAPYRTDAGDGPTHTFAFEPTIHTKGAHHA